MGRGKEFVSLACALALVGGINACSSGGGSGESSPTGSTAEPRGESPTSRTAGGHLKDGETVHIGGSGDILAHVPVWRNAQRNAGGGGFDFDPMFAHVTKPVSALDLAICHMETPLTTTNTDLSTPGTLVFNVPHEIAASVKKAGFDGCDRVGNHVLDRGLKGISETEKSLRNAGLAQQGPSATPTTGQTAVTYDVKGLKVAHLAYSYTSLNEGSSNTHLPPNAPWLKYWQFPIVKADGILADARRAKDAGADVVVLSMHWGAEYSSEASPEQRDLAKKLLESDDVDLILGTHVHVAQPCEKINGKYVVYGMGNFLSNQSPQTASSLRPATQDGVIVDIALQRGKDGRLTQRMTYQPTHVNLDGHVIELATPTKNPEAYRRVTGTMSALGDRCDATPKG